MDDTNIFGPIWISSGRVSGTPCFTGTRVPVKHLFEHLSTGVTIEEFIENFPSVSREQTLETLELVGHLLNDPKNVKMMVL